MDQQTTKEETGNFVYITIFCPSFNHHIPKMCKEHTFIRGKTPGASLLDKELQELKDVESRGEIIFSHGGIP